MCSCYVWCFPKVVCSLLASALGNHACFESSKTPHHVDCLCCRAAGLTAQRRRAPPAAAPAPPAAPPGGPPRILQNTPRECSCYEQLHSRVSRKKCDMARDMSQSA